MRKLFYIALIFFAAASCTKYQEIWDKLYDHEGRIDKLERLCNEMNTNISSLQIIVSALENNDYLTDIIPVLENGKEVGYTLYFSKELPVTIYHGEDGIDGEDGNTPVLSVRQGDDGRYYWTLDGEWLLNDVGEKVPVSGQDGTDGKQGDDGITPSLKIEDGSWWISYDDGSSWNPVPSDIGYHEPIFSSVSQDEYYIYLTLSDGTVLTIPTISLIEKNITSEVRLAKQYDLVVGDKFQMFYAGVVKTFNIKNEGLRVVCKVGKQMERYYEYTPTESDAGKSYTLKLSTRRFDGSVISLGETTLVVHPKLTDDRVPTNVNMLIFGDSLTSGGYWAGEGLRRIYGSDLTISPTSLGITHSCTTYGANKGIVNGYEVWHEGYGGWTWASFLKKIPGRPFYDEASDTIDFNYHAAMFNNPGPDVIAVLLTWNSGIINGSFDFSSAISSHMNDATILLRKAHEDFPNAKIICLGIQVSSLNGGTGDDYGATGTYSDPYATAFYAFDYNKALEELVTNDEFGQYCCYIDTKEQFDTEYNMPSQEIPVNERNDKYTEIVGTNGVHPSIAGYYQIGDAFYRALHRVLPAISK